MFTVRITAPVQRPAAMRPRHPQPARATAVPPPDLDTVVPPADPDTAVPPADRDTAQAAVVVDYRISLASPSVTRPVTATAIGGTSLCRGGFGIPAASATTRDLVSALTAAATAADMAAEVVDMVVEAWAVVDTEAMAEATKRVIRLSVILISIFSTANGP